jgi:hypothetical protein
MKSQLPFESDRFGGIHHQKITPGRMSDHGVRGEETSVAPFVRPELKVLDRRAASGSPRSAQVLTATRCRCRRSSRIEVKPVLTPTSTRSGVSYTWRDPWAAAGTL